MRVLDWLCGAMGVKPQRLTLEICADTAPEHRTGMPTGAVGLYECGEQQAVIRVRESQVADPQRLAATLAHELAHELLLGGGLLTTNVPDHEDLTDLLPVFLGTGVFAANSTLHEQYRDSGTWSSWQIGKQGYLPARVFGYAFALFAFVRGEDQPPWAQHLRLDAADTLWKGLRYPRRTNDSLFRPDAVGAAPVAWPRGIDFPIADGHADRAAKNALGPARDSADARWGCRGGRRRLARQGSGHPR